MTEDSKKWFEGIESIVDEPLKFKAKLDIGENAYTTLRLKNTFIKGWDTFGVASSAVGIAKSATIAGTFFAPSGLAGFFGLATATTPVGWVIAAGVIGGGAWLGITNYFEKSSGSRTTVIPDFINTPLDVLALGLFDLLSPLAMKIAHIDGNIDDSERDHIKNYFCHKWGYNEEFVLEGIKFAESNIDSLTVKEITQNLADLQKENPDCNYDSMANEILTFLEGIVEADGRVDEREEMAIDRVKSIFEETGKFSVKKLASKGLDNLSNTASSTANVVSDTAKSAAETFEASTKKTTGYISDYSSNVKKGATLLFSRIRRKSLS